MNSKPNASGENWANKEVERLNFQQSFFAKSMKGGIAKLIVMGLFREAGFEVYPFGYESTFSVVKEKLRGHKDSTSLKIRHMPDILVFKPSNEESTKLIEVKYSSSFNAQMNNLTFRDYKTHWGDAYIVFVTPNHNFFYIQKIKDMKVVGESKPYNCVFFDLEHDFKPMMSYDEFKNIDASKVQGMKVIVTNISKILDKNIDASKMEGIRVVMDKMAEILDDE